jgi:hypothetical protein
VGDADIVSIEEAIARIGTGKYIHTLMQVRGANMLVGCDHHRNKLIALMRKHRIENSGDAAAAVGHTLVLADYRPVPLFIEAAPSPQTPLDNLPI